MNQIDWHGILERPWHPETRACILKAMESEKLASWMEETVNDDLDAFQRKLKVYVTNRRSRKVETASPKEVAHTGAGNTSRANLAGANGRIIPRTGDGESNRRLRLRHEKSRKPDEQSRIVAGSGIPTITPRVLRIPEAAKYIGATNWRMETLLREREIRWFMQGKRRVVDIKDLDAWIEAEKRK